MSRRLRSILAPRSLAARIVASVALGLALLLLLFSAIALWTIQESAKAAYRERVTLAQALASRVDDVLRYTLLTLEHAAVDITLEPGRPLSQAQREHLVDLRHQVGSFAVLSVADAAGTVIWSEPSRSDVAIGKPLEHRPVQAVLDGGRPWIAEFQLPGDEQQVFACLAVPLHDAHGRVVGVLMADMAPGHSGLNLLPSGAVGEGVYAQLVNASGQLLAGTRGLDPLIAAEHRSLLPELMDAAAPGYRVHEPPPGAPFPSHVVAYAPLTLLPGWGVAVEQPVDAVLALPYRLQERLALFGLMALLLVTLVAWLDVRRVVRPLNQLTTAAGRFAAGQLDEPLRLDRADELGILAHAFDTMRQRLRASLAEVAEWNRSALLDPERVIALVVQKARDLAGADVAGLSLVEESSGDLTWRLLVGGSERFRQIRLQPGEGIAGYVVQTARPLVVDDWARPAADRPATAPIVGLEGLRAVLAVPLQSGGRAFGMLMVAHRRPTPFPDDQVALLASLADQAAVALENARLYAKVQYLAVLEERERIAREMHDGLGQVLGYVNTKTMAVARLLETGRLDEAREQVAQLEAAAKEVYADVREGVLSLRTSLGPGHGLLAALREYLAGFEQQSGIPTGLEAPDGDAALRLPLAAELQLLRIIQEALTNVRKHARASHAAVRFAVSDGVLQIVVEDDGQGFDPERVGREGWPRFGLQTMRERAEAISGVFAVESRLGEGTRIRVTIPQAQQEAADGAHARLAGR